MRLDHLLSKEIPEPDEVRINVAVYRLLVVSFERVNTLQRIGNEYNYFILNRCHRWMLSFNMSSHSFGGDGGGEPHVPIPNTTVKPSSADGT